MLRCVGIFLADVHWGFLVIVGVDGVVAAVFVLIGVLCPVPMILIKPACLP